MRDRLRRAWQLYANVSAVAMTSAIMTALLLGSVLPSADKPVIETSNFRLITPVVRLDGEFTFQVDRKSYESCGGEAVVTFISKTRPVMGISGRFPFGTPGYNSPPPLTITRPVLRGVTPGRWTVETGIDSKCPTRTRYDRTGLFELEVVDAK